MTMIVKADNSTSSNLDQNNQKLFNLSKAIEINTNDYHSIYERGKVYYDIGQYDNAISDLTKIIQSESYIIKALNARAVCYIEQKLFNEALLDLSKAIEIDPKFEPAYINRGIIFAELNLIEKAILDFSKVIEIYPNHINAYVVRGTAFKDSNLIEKAILDFSKVIEIDPTHIISYNYRSYCYARQGKNKKAILDLSKAIEIDPNNALSYNNRGTNYGSLGLMNEAIKDYSRAIEIDKRLAEPYVNRGNLYLQMELFILCYNDYCSYTYLCLTRSDKFTINLLNVLKFFDYSYPQNILTIYENIDTISFLIEYDFYENAKNKIYEFELLLDFFEKSKTWQNQEFLSIKAILHYYLGGSVSSYILYKENLALGNDLVTSQDLYYYAQSAIDINLDQGAIIEYCIQKISKENVLDRYYLAQLYLMQNNSDQAIKWFVKSNSFIFSQIMLINLLDDDEMESEYFEKINTYFYDNPSIINPVINSIPSNLALFEPYFHYKECADAIEYLNNYYDINLYSDDRPFWETFHFDRLTLDEIKNKVKEKKISEISEKIKEELFKHIGENIQENGLQAIQDLEGAIFKQSKSISSLWINLNSRSIYNDDDFENQLGIEIEEWEINSPILYFMFIKIFYLKGIINQEQVFTLFLYLIKIYSENKRKKIDDAIKDLIKNFLETGRTLLPDLALRASLGSIKNIIPFLQKIFNNEDILVFREVSDYEEFKTNLWKYISLEKETLSDLKFNNKYSAFEWINTYKSNL